MSYRVTCWNASGRSETVTVRATSETAACRAAIRILSTETGDSSWLAGVVL